MLRSVSLLLLVALGLGACQPKQIVGGKPGPRITSVVSLSPSTTEVLVAAAAFTNLVGRTAACNYPEFVKNAQVVANVKPDYEKIARLKPDLVLYDRSLYSEDDVRKIEELGVRTMEMNVRSVDGFVDFLYRLGATIGRETSVSEYADRILDACEQARAEEYARRPRVAIVLGGEGGYLIAGTDTFQADVLRRVGVEAVGPEGPSFSPLNVEAFIRLDPDVVVSGGSAARILADPRFRTVRAVREGRVIDVPEDVLLRAGARVDSLISNLHRYMAQEFGARKAA